MKKVHIVIRRVCQFTAWLALGMPAFGQLTEASLPIDGSYIVRPGVTISTSDQPKGEVCVVAISGRLTEPEVMAIIDEAVPMASRGLSLVAFYKCLGVCKSTWDDEKVKISEAVGFGQIASPAAIILFKRKKCEQRVKEAPSFSITVRQPTLPF